MSNAFGIDANHPATASGQPHALGFSTPRTAPDDHLFEVRNGDAADDAVLVVDKDGDVTAGSPGALTRVVRLLEGREAVRLGSWVIEYNEGEDSLDFLHEPE